MINLKLSQTQILTNTKKPACVVKFRKNKLNARHCYSILVLYNKYCEFVPFIISLHDCYSSLSRFVVKANINQQN